MGPVSPAKVSSFMLILTFSVYANVVAGRNGRHMLAAADPTPVPVSLVTSTCILRGAPNSNCSFNPAITFRTGLEPTTTEDRLYQAVMAHHVLCPQRKTQQQCNTDELIYCIWNQQRESCEADRYASYLLPLACPGSMAHAYLDCMRKANADACKADSTCTAAYNGTCYPRSMVAGAHRSQVPVQSAAEEMALAIVTGDLAVLGSCAGAQGLASLAQLCPFSNDWSHCNSKYCNYDVPPFIPNRQKQQQQRQELQTPATSVTSGNSINKHDRTLHTGRSKPEALAYYGVNPSPICALDVQKLPTVLHQLLNITSNLQAAIAAADQECEAADTVQYSVEGKQATCGYSTFQYDIDSVARAAGIGPAPAVAAASQQITGNRAVMDSANRAGALQKNLQQMSASKSQQIKRQL